MHFIRSSPFMCFEIRIFVNEPLWFPRSVLLSGLEQYIYIYILLIFNIFCKNKKIKIWTMYFLFKILKNCQKGINCLHSWIEPGSLIGHHCSTAHALASLSLSLSLHSTKGTSSSHHYQSTVSIHFGLAPQ